MNNLTIAAAFYELADLLEFQGETSFKLRAYRKAAETIEQMLEPVADLARTHRLLEVPGIGKAIAGKIQELLGSGHMAKLEALRQAIPPGVRDLTDVPGLGGKTALLLYRARGIDSLDKLEQAAREGQLRDLPGWGDRKEASVLAGLASLRRQGERSPLGAVWHLAETLADHLRRHPDVVQADVAGSIRRRQETVEDIDLVVATTNPAAVLDFVAALPIAGDVMERSPERLALTTSLGRRLEVLAVPPPQYAAALLLLTGTAAHVQALQALAPIPTAATEAEIYRALGLPYIEPELREQRGEIAAARAGALPRLVTVAAIRGDLHTHTTASDGTATLLEMAAAARALGHRYLAICDHSQSLRIANGLTPARLALQAAEIRELNGRWPDFRLLRGTEVDIRKDGTLDFPDEILADLDVVVASIHSHMGLDAAAQTERLLRAVRNPHVDIIGHPTGRILGRREPYELDLARIFAACAETGTALEISASPARLDLSDVHARLAQQQGVRLVTNTDAHAPHELQLLPYGVNQARRAWLTAGDLINTMDLPELLAWLAQPKG